MLRHEKICCKGYMCAFAVVCDVINIGLQMAEDNGLFIAFFGNYRLHYKI